MTDNLNDIQPENDGGYGKHDPFIGDNSITSGDVSVYFRNLESHLISQIRRSDAVVGCVAWLTHPRILDALRGRGVSIIVQKEDFLRPDIAPNGNWAQKLRASYDRLGVGAAGLERMQFSGLVGDLSTSCDPSMDPVRCVGNYNYEKNPAFPRMHNKFLVFCDLKGRGEGYYDEIVPKSVWTGSFNFTKNAVMSLENAVVIRDKPVVAAYFKEYQQIASLSEPLDWESVWVAPEWRVGT